MILLPLLWMFFAPHIKAAVSAYEAGRVAMQQNHTEEAIRSFQTAIEIEPTYREAFEAWIVALVSAGRWDEAANVMTQLLEIDPRALQYRTQLGNILLDQGQNERALAQFSLALDQDPQNADALSGFVSAAQKLNMADRAQQAKDTGHKAHPNDVRFR
jgi:tetratricopeptide (TPR) repeat protein